MAIRDVGSRPGSPGGTAGSLPPAVDQSLRQNGLVANGQTPKDAAQGLLSSLRRGGFSAPVRGELAQQLSTALRGFQGRNGLPVTGLLNADTLSALKNAGIVANPEAQGARDRSAQDGFEKNPTSLKQGEKQRADTAQQSTPDTNFLDALINQLGPGGLSEGMSASDIKGSAGAAGSESRNVEKGKVSEAKKAEGAAATGATTDGHADVELATPQQLDRGNAAGVKVARGLRADTKAEDKRRKDALNGKDPTELGILDEEAEEDALEGAGDDGRRRRGHGGEHDGAQEEGAETSAGAGGGDIDGTERERGNASSGDEDHDDAARGNAQMGDDAEGAGHYRVPSVAEQAAAALERIVKDASEENRATTYSWDVMFYRPGVYGAGQKATELVRLVVDKASAFDPVWQKAQANLVALVGRTDQSGTPPSLEDIIAAMRQARVRDGDESAAALTIVKPIGRA